MTSFGHSVLVVDDDPAVGKVLGALLRQEGYSAQHVSSGAEALEAVERRPFDVVVTDLRMPGMDGMELLGKLQRRWPELPVMLLTAHGTVDHAVEAMKRGAAGFMLKPFDRPEILYEIRKVLASSSTAESSPAAAGPASAIVGASPAMGEVRELIGRAAESNATVLVRGESGTGKELVVRAIHEQSTRRELPLVTVHCGALPETLIEDELFGHEKGAFTGATSARQGRLALAEGGTLFLDEVGDIPLPVQVKLLRVIQEKQFEPLGGARTITADVRFVAATHRDLEAMCREGTFREDLFYRLDVITIWLPPLRQRRGDVAPLAQYFCSLFAKENSKAVELDQAALERLSSLPWPGNVRELQNFVERLVVLGEGSTITEADVQRELERRPLASSESAAPAQQQSGAPSASEAAKTSGRTRTLDEARRDAERRYLLWALGQCGGNRTRAARISGVSRRTFYNLLQKHELD